MPEFNYSFPISVIALSLLIRIAALCCLGNLAWFQRRFILPHIHVLLQWSSVLLLASNAWGKFISLRKSIYHIFVDDIFELRSA